ncbi:hypothetical protein [Natronorubrum sp. DTA28]|uniref:hypothetical protein n=1 Tax=Natronorubrum sp. DTA28 TaxID=3447019 RepID=UPI003F849743
MSSATVKSVLVKTAASSSGNDENLGYELQMTKDDYDSSIIIQETPDPNMTGSRYTLVSSGRVFPDDVQATMKPYFDRAGFNHHLNPGTTKTVEETEVRVMIEAPNGEDYHIQKLDTDRYYVSNDNKPVKPPQSVEQKAKTVFPDFQSML